MALRNKRRARGLSLALQEWCKGKGKEKPREMELGEEEESERESERGERERETQRACLVFPRHGDHAPKNVTEEVLAFRFGSSLLSSLIVFFSCACGSNYNFLWINLKLLFEDQTLNTILSDFLRKEVTVPSVGSSSDLIPSYNEEEPLSL